MSRSLKVVDLAIHTLDVCHIVGVLLLDRVTCRTHQVGDAISADFVPHKVRHNWRLHVVAEMHGAEHVRRRRRQKVGKGFVCRWCGSVVFVSVLLLEHLVEPDRLQLIGLEVHQLQVDWLLGVVGFRQHIAVNLSKVKELGKSGWNETVDALEAILTELVSWCAAAQQVEGQRRLPVGHLLGVGVGIRLKVVAGLGRVAGVLDEPLWFAIGLNIAETGCQVTLWDGADGGNASKKFHVLI